MNKPNNTPFKLFTRSFTTTNNHFMDNNDSSLDKNNELFLNKQNIETIENKPVDKSLSNDELFSLLQNNKQNITENIDSANKSINEANRVCARSTQIYSIFRSALTNQEIDTMERNLADNNTSMETLPRNSSDEEKALFSINKHKKRLLDAMYKAKTIDEALSSREDNRAAFRKDSVVNSSKNLMQEFNSLAENINNGVNNNNSIRRELQSRNISLYPEEFINTNSDDA